MFVLVKCYNVALWLEYGGSLSKIYWIADSIDLIIIITKSMADSYNGAVYMIYRWNLFENNVACVCYWSGVAYAYRLCLFLAKYRHSL